jgi:hypothetical protein
MRISPGDLAQSRTLTCAEVVNILPAGRSGPADYTLRIQVAAFEGGRRRSGARGRVDALERRKQADDHKPKIALHKTGARR